MLCDQPVEDALPQQMYLEYFSPDYRLNYNRRPVSQVNVLSAAAASCVSTTQSCPELSVPGADEPHTLPALCLQSWPGKSKNKWSAHRLHVLFV